VLELFNKYLGTEGNMLKSKVPTLMSINEIVKVRGEIAHNLYSDDYVKEDLVNTYYETIQKLVVEIELYLWEYIPSITNGKRPWQNTYNI
jgi:GH35 family endo-1,4-beta-xylanase